MKKNFLFIFVLTLLSCGKDDQRFSYSFDENGCKTGKHVFEGDSQEEVMKRYCAALQDNKLNKNCALRFRKSRFESECKGEAWSPH